MTECDAGLVSRHASLSLFSVLRNVHLRVLTVPLDGRVLHQRRKRQIPHCIPKSPSAPFYLLPLCQQIDSSNDLRLTPRPLTICPRRMYPTHRLDTPPPPSQFRRPWSPDPYDPLPATSSQLRTNQTHNQRREASDVSVEALDLADYARTLNMRSAEHNNPSHPYSIPVYRAFDYPPSPPVGGFRSFALRSQDTLSPPSLASDTTAPSRTSTGTLSHAPHRRPFSLPPSSYPQYPANLHSYPSVTSRGYTNPSNPGAAPPSEIDISQFPSFTRGWYAQEPKQNSAHPQDPFIPSHPNVFDPAFPSDTYRSDQFALPRLGYYTPPPSYPSYASGSSRDYLPWSGDPPETNGPLDAEVKEERMRMLEREFGAKGNGQEEGEKTIGSVNDKGNLITEGPKKRLAIRWLQVILALVAGGASIYAGLVWTQFCRLVRSFSLSSL